jgi:hypothetical protein
MIAMVRPFVHTLGYDIFNPAEVVPEFTAGIGTKKGEKVDCRQLHRVAQRRKEIGNRRLLGENSEKLSALQREWEFATTSRVFEAPIRKNRAHQCIMATKEE